MHSRTSVSKWIVLVWINWSSATSISDGILYHGFFWRKIFVSRDVLSWHFQTQYCQKVWTELSNFEELVSTSRRHKKLFSDANCFQFCWQHSSLTMCNCNVRINLCQSWVGFQVDSDETDVKANFKRQTKVKFISSVRSSSGYQGLIRTYPAQQQPTFSNFSNSSDSKVKVKVKGPNMCYIF